MAATHEHVNLELMDAGANIAQVIRVLSKVKGLSLSPEELVKSAPCTIAEEVPRQMAETLRTFLTKAGATVELKEPGEEEEEEFELELDDGSDDLGEEDEGEWLTSEAISGPESEEEEEDLFSPDDFPVAEDVHEEDLLESAATSPEQAAEDDLGGWVLDDSSHAGEGDSGDGSEGPSDDFGGFSAAAPSSSSEDEGEDEDLFGDEEEFFDEDDEELATEEMAEAPKAADKLKGFLSKVSDSAKQKTAKPKEKKEKPEKRTPPPMPANVEPKKRLDEEEEAEEKKGFVLPAGIALLAPALTGFVLGALIFGVWGMMSKSGLKKELASLQSQTQGQPDMQSQNAQLQQKIDQQAQEIETLKQQVADAGAQGERAVTPQSISPSPVPDSESAQVLNAVLSSFETLKNTHIETLAQSYETQKKSPCAKQVLLDGEGTSTYAQVVKNFSAKYTAFDVMRSDSLVTPFVAELKIPFKQEMKVGADESACKSGALKELPSPRHHEFGNFYGIWIIEYQYKNGKWVRKATVKERNRALYEKAFKVGSPDYAKFLIDETLYPGFQN